MPELPEVEITARRLSRAAAGAEIESALAPGMVTMKTFDPPIDALAGRTIAGVRRAGKMLVVDTGELVVLIHLMSAGRLQLWDDRASLRDRASRLLIRLEGGRELRLREFGTQQRAWAKLLPAEALGPTTRSRRSALTPTRRRRWRSSPGCSTSPATCTRCCATSARSRGSGGRGWTSCSGPRGCRRSRRGPSSTPTRASGCTRRATRCWAAALEHYEQVIGDKVPDKLPMPLQVHRRAGEDCPRCGATIQAIHFKDYVMCYCPEEQTNGRVLKDRRLSRLLK